METKTAKKPWDGRFTAGTDRLVEAFTSSIQTDKHLYLYDIKGSIAHCTMLAKQSIITEDEASKIIMGLKNIKKEIENGTFLFDDSLEDIHMHIEARLVQTVGQAAQKLHTARSRNDQVALDVRLYLKNELLMIMESLNQFKKTLLSLAKKNIDVILPGYTHLQRAQPILFSHHMMAYYEMFSRDCERFQDCLKRTDVIPLGSAALAGTTYPIDREYTAKLLGFSKISENSIDSVSDRDFIMEFLSAASICMVHFSRLSEEFILWSSYEFNFIEIPDSFATGSSIMPQKKNPDICELIRGKTGRVFGDLIAILSMMKSQPLAYNRDMQEDKEPLFNSVDILKSSIAIYTKLLPEIKINTKTMEQAASKGFLNATDLADYLAGKGLPFRKAHACAGNAVNYALARNKELHELSLDELRDFSTLIKEDIYEALTLKQMINRRNSHGGTAIKNVKAAIKKAEKMIK